MRSRIYNIVLLASMLLTVVAITSCNRSPQGSDEELTLLIKFSPTHPFRTIEQGAANDSYTVGTYKSITLFFYDAQDNPTEPYRVELKSDADIAEAMGDGYKIKVRQSVAQVSAVAGRSGVLKPDNLNTLSIYDLQTLGGADDATNSFLRSVPYVASKAPVKTLPSDPNKLTVDLEPKPNVARLEVSGDIAIPTESQKTIADWIVNKKMIPYAKGATNYSYVASPCELPIRYIEDFTIRGIYLNNYKETVGAASRNFLASDKYDTTDKVWTGHRTEMHTLFGKLNEANNYAKTMTAGKVDAYQIYPGEDADPEALDHIIVEVEYTLHTRVGYFDAFVYNKDKSDYVYACSRVETKPVQKLRRFITIRKFLVGEGANEKSLVAFEAGKIYRINLNYLSPLFSMNTNPGIEKTDDITEITPRRERTDELPEETTAAVLVDVSGWTHINIDTELE
ncbi:hypothetical protein [uncultured Porphyromonas sp.]|uniref:hypothetical protein n=1 Tax=uncultured Porphyromonas sp. TaxID=159274 RepID=UPI002610BBB3|nr:hypothetical protein [uncultured Porphyromonas sp.]